MTIKNGQNRKIGVYMIDNNPLKQYFRRPALYLKLPSEGVGYSPNVLQLPENGELPVYPMTAVDEITTKTPDALYNGMAVIEVIKSCIPAIKDPWQITSIDLDAILVAIRIATNGNEMEIDTVCPNCEEMNKYGLNLTGILSKLKPGNFNEELKIGSLKVKFRPLSFKESNKGNIAQVEMQRVLNNINSIEDEEKRAKVTSEGLTKISKIGMEIIASTIDYIEMPDGVKVSDKKYIQDFLENTDKKTYTTIREHSITLRQNTEIKPLQMKCVHCKHEYEQPFTLNISDFFA